MNRRVVGIVLLTVLSLTLSSARGNWHVWAVGETARVLRSAPPAQGTAVTLHAARNEWESFQILMRSDAPVTGIRVEASDLTGPAGHVLRTTDMRLFREHPLHLTVGTVRNDHFKPDWYPDALIPLRHPLTRKPLGKARFHAMPFDLPDHQTHGFWIDIHVPPSTPAGLYRGTFHVTSATEPAVAVPVSCTVWPFSLPDRPTLRTAFGSPAQRMRAYYRARAKTGKESSPSDWNAVETECADMLARHHINATPVAGSLTPVARADGSYAIPVDQVNALRRFVDRYHVNAVQVPAPTRIVKDPDREQKKMRAWLRAWDEAARLLDRPEVLFYTYLRDEPNDAEAYQFVRKWGRAIRSANTVVKVLVVEQTWAQKPEWGDLYGAVDIWCPLFSLFRPASAARRQALGETVWTYTALCQLKPTPWWHIDYPLLNYRVPAWIAWRYRIKGLLYWGGLSYWRAVDDPWTDPATYHGSGTYQHGKQGRVYNGEGSLVYPGRAVGYDGIAPSMRLKALRDSIEDYEYLAILQRAGRAAEAEKIVVPLATSWFQWAPNPSRYESARIQLAKLIVAAQTAGE